MDEWNSIRLFDLVSKQEAYKASFPHRGETGKSSGTPPRKAHLPWVCLSLGELLGNSNTLPRGCQCSFPSMGHDGYPEGLPVFFPLNIQFLLARFKFSTVSCLVLYISSKILITSKLLNSLLFSDSLTNASWKIDQWVFLSL